MSSWLKSIHNAQTKGKTGTVTEFQGPIDLLIVSPAAGEPWFLYFLKFQMSKDGAFFVVKMFIKKYKHNGEVAWSFTFDKKDRWHSVRCRQPARTRRDCSPCPRPAPLAPRR